MKALSLAIVCCACLALAAMPSLAPAGTDRLGLATIGIAAFIALVLIDTKDKS